MTGKNNTKPTTIERLLTTADFFSDLSKESKRISRQYRKAVRLTRKAQDATQKAMEASLLASQYADDFVGDPELQEVPCILLEDNSNKEFWDNFFDEVARDFAEVDSNPEQKTSQKPANKLA